MLAAGRLKYLKRAVGFRQSAPTPICCQGCSNHRLAWLLRAAGFWTSIVAELMRRQTTLDAVQLAVTVCSQNMWLGWWLL